MENIKLASIYLIAGLIFVVGGAFISSKLISNKTENQVSVVSTSTQAFAPVTCPLDTQSFQSTKSNKNVVLLSANKSSFGVNGSFKNHDYNVTLKRTGLNSKVACGYLFYTISVGSKPIEQNYENLYMAPAESQQFGGQILPTNQNAININEVSNGTEILIPLNNIPYDGTSRVNIKQADWVSLLNVTDQMTFNIALNTTSQYGQINDIEIAYKCWNPQTGLETNDCNLNVAN